MAEVSFASVAQERTSTTEANAVPESAIYDNLLHEDPTSPGEVFLPELRISENSRNPYVPPLFGEEPDKNFFLTKGKNYRVREDELLKALDERTSGVKGGESFILFGHDGLNRDIAVRILHKNVDLVANLEKFYSTTRLQANLEHHRIVPVIDMTAISTNKGEVFPIAIMPKIEGISGFDAIKSKQLTTVQIITLLEQIAEALDYMHDRKNPIMHLDIKPGNIMLKNYSLKSADNKIDARLLDFGVALGNIGNDTRKRPVSGYTKSYAAPEVKVRSRRHLISPRSDEYSLAITALVALGIYTKFNSEDGTLTQPGDQLNPLPEQYRYLETIFRKALAFEPSERYATCGDFVNALREKLVMEGHGMGLATGEEPTLKTEQKETIQEA